MPDTSSSPERPGARSGLHLVAAILELVGVGIAAGIGVVAGAVLTFTHRQLEPWGLVAGLVIVTALLLGFRLAFDGRRHAIAAGFGLVAAVAVFALLTPSGSVLVVADALGYAWVFGSALFALVVLTWPRRALGDAETTSSARGQRR